MQEVSVWFYGTLSNARCAIGPVGPSLVYTMPVLPSIQYESVMKMFSQTDHARGSVHCRIIEPVHYVDFKVIAL